MYSYAAGLHEAEGAAERFGSHQKGERMSFAVRFAGRVFHRSSARAVVNSALATRHRLLSSGSSTAASGKGGGLRPGSSSSAAVGAVEVTETVPAGGGKAEQGGVKLDICGDLEGVSVRVCRFMVLYLIKQQCRCRPVPLLSYPYLLAVVAYVALIANSTDVFTMI